ncbi:MAG: hypothetical protein MJ124_08570 [Lachnospiraceae bacterium]|nr:hypothetical protein [Lachnospiraceae bacterium]
MSGKEFFREVTRDFFVIVTFCNLAVFVLGSIFKPEARFGYEAFLSPLIYGVLGVLPGVLMYSNHELKIREVIVRKAIQLVFLEAIMYLVVFGIDGMKKEDPRVLVGLGVSVLIIYVLVPIIDWIIDSREAKQLTEDLLEFQKNEKE